MTDKNGKLISKGDTVDVDPPTKSDLHEHEFRGEVLKLYPDGETLCVVDQDNNCYDVDADKVEVA
jgi:hypothetical protein